MKVNWQGVIPAITTKFNRDDTIDYTFFANHCRWLVDAGCIGLVPLGSLGEGATLSFEEKIALLKTALEAVGDRVPVIPGIASLSTTEAVRLAQAAERIGCSGLMVLPPYVYSTDWREMKAHVDAVLRATSLPAMLYNNPLAYKTDFLPEQIAELAREHSHLQAVKESSADVRRIAAIRALIGERLELLVGVDDCLVEAVQAGAMGWIAGLVNAFPHESVALFQLAQQARLGQGDHAQLEALYNWFLPLLRLDTVPKFVQLIKLAQEMVGMGSAQVRGPRLELEGEELASARQIIEEALKHRPVLN
ncbi:dihydrodipicolinate synthase family protein [Ktedonobacter sp. SOSP1-85]|uniref:dihydrodipicolinate synthase family protein n=1 Tax=Ktedonobacter sp. SOSP1-85 TaxID=2778367 RepID=UPI0019162ED6|nr:dihydrodipicolinate synthase family protein [Ktedonobacter sp. SOSP1-85]GHO72977.1 dihydrodipicolinate synthase family protein [Ktedonobacter sp. SOSP1-85]